MEGGETSKLTLYFVLGVGSTTIIIQSFPLFLVQFYQLVSKLRSWNVESLVVTKMNTRIETHMEAMEKTIEENRKAVESQLSSIEMMIQRLATAWEKKSPTTNVHNLFFCFWSSSIIITSSRL